MISTQKLFLFCLLVSLLSACTFSQPQTVVTITPTSTPSATATITPTVIWFPPTSTHTPFPTPIVTPTEDMRPEFGEIIFQDDFSEKEGWSLIQNDQGSIAYGNSELTIAIGETNAYLYSVRLDPIFSDFYLELTAAPNLCTGADEYGVLFRVSTSNYYYRYALTCDGQVKLDRVVDEGATSVQPSIYSGSVPPGAPSFSRLGILAVGKEMRFYINGTFQFSIKDPVLSSGGLGVFAHSVNKKAVTINFSDLIVYDVPK